MPVLEIVQVGHPALRQPARTLAPEELGTPDFLRLVDDLRETMRAAPGVGLAAPQVGLSIRVAVIEDRAQVTPEDRAAREREPVPFHVIVNPTLTVEEAEPPSATFFEGCLSLAGFGAEVERARAVRVDALDEHGRPITLRARGWYARILQHEIDHLNGTLYIDRMNTRTFRQV